MKHLLPELPYEYNALEPFIDEETMRIHHTKHHQAYIDKLNAGIEAYPELQGKPVEELVRDLEKVPEAIRTIVRNHGGGHLNHGFFWPLLKKEVPFKGPAAEAIIKEFGGIEAFREKFAAAAAGVFGSGWAWLILKEGRLEIVQTPNQDNPVTIGKTPILGLDVWEHAYYLKYQNKRPDYVNAFFNVINWERVNELYELGLKK